MSENLFYTLLGAGDLIFFVLLLRYRKRRKYHRNELQYTRKVHGVHDLEAVANKIEELDNAIIQIELAALHKVKGVTVTVPDVLNQKHESTLLIDGHSDSSRYLLETLNAERNRLRVELDKKIERLYRNGSTETITGERLSALLSSPAPDPETMHRSFIRKTADKANVSRTGDAL